MEISRLIFQLLLFIATLQSIYYYPRLLEIVASHFDGAGTPNGWSSKMTFFVIYWGVIALTLFIFLGLPKVLSRLPDSLINLPNKDYWLALERREETISFITYQMEWFGIATLIVIISAIQLAIQANLPNVHHFSTVTMWGILAAYGLFILIWTIRFIFRFSKVT